MFGYWHSVFLALVCMKCSLAFQPFGLTRLINDKFKNPTVKMCNYKGKEFCQNRNGVCDWSGVNGCCYCLCEYDQSTFDVSTLKCRKNNDFRSGCFWSFDNVYSGQPIKLLDLSRKGAAKFTFSKESGHKKIKSCKIDSINMFSHDGKFYLVRGKVFTKVKPTRNEVEIEWGQVKQNELHGKIFKVSATCEIEKTDRSKLKKSGCFVFKSSGKLIVSPILSPSPTTTFSPSKTETFSEKPEQPSAHISTPRFLPSSSSRVAQTVPVTSIEPQLVEPTKVTPSSPNTLTTTAGFDTSHDVVSPLFPTTLPKSTKGFEVREKITTEEPVLMPSSTSNIAEASLNYVAPKARKQSDGGDKVAIISSAVVICVLIVGILLLLLWLQRRKRRTSGQRKNNRGITNGDTTVDNNAMMMNNHDNIYAEADNVVSSKCVSGEGHYSSLDKTIPEEMTAYETLRPDNTNVYEQILEKKGPVSVPLLVTAPGDKIDEQVYSILEGEVSTPPIAEAVYSDVDELKGPKNDGNSSRITPSGCGNERDERVYSVLEDDNESSTPPVSEAVYSDPNDGPRNDEPPRQVLRSKPGAKHEEQVYSVLEENGPGNESSPAMPDDSDYLTVLHTGTSDYEQPFDAPVPDA